MVNKVVKRRKSNVAARIAQVGMQAALAAMPGKKAQMAIQGARMAYGMYKKYKKGTKEISTQVGRTSRGKWSGQSRGTYAGKFAKPRKVKANVLSVSKYKGYSMTYEQYGRVQDPNAIVFTNSTYYFNYMGSTISGAILRKLFKIAGIVISDSRKPVPLNDLYNNFDWSIDVEVVDEATGVTNWAGTAIGPSQTFDDVVVTMTAFLGDAISQYLLGVNTLKPRRVALIHTNLGGFAPVKSNAAIILLEDEFLTMQSNCKLVIQNRTAGSGASPTDLSSDRIDSQPVAVAVYGFKHAHPRLGSIREGSDNDLNRVGYTGFRSVRAAQFSAENQVALENAPDVKVWKNCSGKATSILQPGSMKKTVLTQTVRMKFYEFLNRYRVAHNSAPTLSTVGSVPGSCNIIHVSEILRTESTNPLTLQWERHYEIGAFLTTKTKTSAFLNTLAVVQEDNVPPP